MKCHLKEKFLVPISALIIVGMGVSMFVAYISSTNAVEQTIKDQLSQIVALTAQSLESWIREAESDVRSWSATPIYATAVLDSLESHAARTVAAAELAALQSNYDCYERIYLLNATGEVIASSTPQTTLENLATAPYFQQALQGQLALSDVEKSAISNNPVFMIAAPVKTQEQIIGVMVGVVNLEQFGQKFIDPIKVGQTGYAYVFRRDGVVFAHPKKENILTLNVTDYDFGKEMIGQSHAVIAYDWEGVHKLVAFQRLEATGWTIGAGAATREMLAPIYHMAYINGGVASLVLVILIAFIVLLVRSIVAPLQRIVTIANAIGDGDMEQEISIVRYDEIGILAEAMRRMIANLNAAVQVAGQIANGDMTVVIPVRSEKDALGKALTAMTTKLRGIIRDIKAATENVASGSQFMSSGSEELSQGATEQAAAAEQASSSMEEMAANICQNAENARQTEQIATKAAQDAHDSGLAVAETVQAIREIAKKVQVIDELARQTRMLSLNATIEAAKAQEFGKGFGVVASEVRALAERSQSAASEITNLADASVKIAEVAGERLRTLVPDIRKTAELVQEISAATSEQERGAGQINTAIQQLDQVIQQNATASEEMASTSEELASQAEHLQAAIEFFKIQESRQENVSPLQQSIPNPMAAKLHAKIAHLKHPKEVISPKNGGNGHAHVPQPVFATFAEGGDDALDEGFERY